MLNESCDNLLWYRDGLNYDNSDAYPLPFGVDRVSDEIVIGTVARSHMSLEDFSIYDEFNVKQYDYFGRLWLKDKIITFWYFSQLGSKYPETNSEVKKIVKKIENFFNNSDKIEQKIRDIPNNLAPKQIWNNGWRIEIKTENIKDDFRHRIKWKDKDKNIYKLIPLEKFNGSVQTEESEYLQHILSPMRKKRIKGYKQHQMKYKMPDEPEIFAKRRLKYLYQEACDEIYVDGKAITHKDNAIPFIVYYGNDEHYIAIGKKNGTHSDITNPDWKKFYREYNGRLFINEKIITFWDYPSKDKFFNILKLLKKKIKKLNINWDEWKVELVKNEIKDEIFYDSIYSPEIYSYIPVKLYNGSKNLPEEIHQQHIVSPMKKKQTTIRQHQMKYKMPGEPEIIAKMRLKNMYQEKLISKFKLFETPDTIFTDEYDLSWRNDTITFFYYKNELFSEFENSHADMFDDIIGDYDYVHNLKKKYREDMNLDHYPQTREILDYSGRLWYNENIISFWKYPENKTILYKILKEVLKKDDIEFEPTEWKIEIRTDDKNTLNSSGDWTDWKFEIISIKDYKTSSKYSGEELNIQHILSPMKKKQTNIKQHQMKYKMPGESEIAAKRRLKYLYQEKLISKFKLFENPDTINTDEFDLKWTFADARHFGYRKNTFYLGKGPHGDRWKLKYPGRIWLDNKIISFWKYPEDNKKLRKIITDIENRLKMNIWNDNEWRMEIIINPREGEQQEWWYESKSKIIPLVDYKSSRKRSEEELQTQHIISPMKKKQTNVRQHQIKYKLPGEPEIVAKRRLKYLYQENIQNEIGFGDDATFFNKSGLDFWGNIGAGILPISKKTGRFLVAFRSKYVNEANTWGIFGGKLDENEKDIQTVALREFEEETGYEGNIRLIPSYIFETDGFKYHNFIGIIDDEFDPELNWETESVKWVNFKELMELYPKHFGLKDLIKNDLNKIKKYSK